MKYSIIVPTLNCRSEIELLLESMLAHNIHKESDLEVIIVDADSDDGTKETIKSHSFPRLIVEKGITKGMARTRGVQKAKGNIIVNLDSDVEITEEWLPALKESMKHNQIVAGYSPHPKRGFIPRASIWIDGQDITFPFCNIAHRKSVFGKVGFIKDTELSEDIDFNYKCVKAGYSIIYNPKMKVLHFHTQNKKEFLKQAFLYGRCRYQINKRFPDLKKKQFPFVKKLTRFGFAGLGYMYEGIKNERN